jgi:TonB family protein
MRRFPLAGLALVIFVSSVLPLLVLAQQSSPAVATIAYPNNSEGLRQLLNDVLAVAKKDEVEQLQSKIRDMEIPDYESWYTKNFGREKGESWAEGYGKSLTKHEEDFEGLMLKLAQMEGEFVVQKVDIEKRLDLFNGPLDSYTVHWSEPIANKGKELVNIADFFFVQGKFRWDSAVQYFPFQPPSKHSLVPAKVVKKVQPEYPAEARQNNIQGTVRIQVIIQKDGSVTVQNVVEGDPILSPAAIEAVKQWRYNPTLFDGKPVDVQTTIEVDFTLRP